MTASVFGTGLPNWNVRNHGVLEGKRTIPGHWKCGADELPLPSLKWLLSDREITTDRAIKA